LWYRDRGYRRDYSHPGYATGIGSFAFSWVAAFGGNSLGHLVLGLTLNFVPVGVPTGIV